MDRTTAVTTWRDVCGSDTLMASGIVTGRMLEEFAQRIEAAERERWVLHCTEIGDLATTGVDSTQEIGALLQRLSTMAYMGPNVAISGVP